ncbi:hypothetical protein [Corynebacterium coyleae]|uniref:hypothetical protein n=1 Tax=Corynebacterium coyleae TaxID=53374 RepID=UPI00254BF06E|nr:hypothetical protein [Corynebacterium coyleae]MDK8241708.1 hypothetical protein [Corynebacterium coyleae]
MNSTEGDMDANAAIERARRTGRNPLYELYWEGCITAEDLEEAPVIHALVTAPIEQLLGELADRAREKGIK